MKKLMEKHRKFMKGNAGFSLVELIIVIAIMAALVAILAPQYIKYVEKSRIATDQSLAEEIFSTVQVIVLDPEYADKLDTDFEVTLSKAEGIAVSGTDSDAGGTNATVADALKEIYGTDLSAVKATNKTGATFVVNADITDGLYAISRDTDHWGNDGT